MVNKITVLLSAMEALNPVIEMFMTGKLPKFLEHNITIEPFLKDNIENFIVYDLTRYATKEEAEQHKKIQLNLDGLAKSLSKK